MSEDSEEKEREAPDSLTLGQLKRIVKEQQTRPKQPKYSFEYADRDSVKNEIGEWFDYFENEHLIDSMNAFDNEYSGKWIKMTFDQRMEILMEQLKSLTSEDDDIRIRAASIVSYISQGNFGEALSANHQTHWIMENARLQRLANSLPSLYQALQKAFDSWFSDEQVTYTCMDQSLTVYRDAFLQGGNEVINADLASEINEEILNLMTAIYFLVEGSRQEAQLQRSMASLDPPITSYLLEQISRSREALPIWPGPFPIRYVILLLWKCILCTYGGTKEIARTKQVNRWIHGLSPSRNEHEIVATPLDYALFRSEIVSKYPSFDPPPPVFPNTESRSMANGAITDNIVGRTCPHSFESPAFINGNWASTPAPSPPPSPKGKKSTFQTNQALPFLLPLGLNPSDASYVRPGGDMKLPVSICEASQIFSTRMRTTIPLLQLWKERETFLKHERGWVTSQQLDDNKEFVPDDDVEFADKPAVTAQLEMLEKMYKAILPQLQSCVVAFVSLGLSLAEINMPPPSGAGIYKPESNDSGNSRTLKTIQEISKARNYEITIKAISACLLLLLKWFRVSHVLKYEYLSQLLLDANWIHVFQQILMASDPLNEIHTVNEEPRQSYFVICGYLSGRMHAEPTESPLPSAISSSNSSLNGLVNGLGIEGTRCKPEDSRTMDKYSWRNFFAMINLMKTTQKLVKKKAHRNFLLAQSKTWLHLRKPLRIPQDELQLYVLKIFKGQVPFCGRKWRQSNMRVITQIYLTCRPELRDDWISGTEADIDLEDALSQEEALRALIQYYNQREYPEEMHSLGFEGDKADDDFFTNELVSLGMGHGPSEGH